jgi:hypothetical protein
VIVDFIDAHKDTFGVEPICRDLQVAPSTYYARRTRPPSARSVTDSATTQVIAMVHADNYGVDGARKLHAEMLRLDHPAARCSVERLMRAAGLREFTRAKGPRTTSSGTGPDPRPDLVERDFTARAPDELWVADITYVRTSWIPAIVATPAMRSGDAGEEVHRGAAAGVHGVDRPRRLGAGGRRGGRGTSRRGLRVDEGGGLVDPTQHATPIHRRSEG